MGFVIESVLNFLIGDCNITHLVILIFMHLILLIQAKAPSVIYPLI